MKIILEKLEAFETGLTVFIIHDDVLPDKLNDECGAEYVHKDQKYPQ